MQRHQVAELTYDDAIKEFGAAITSFSVGQFVLLDEASSQFLAESDAPVTPTNSVVVAEVAEVSADRRTAKLSKFRRIYQSGGNCPESGDDDVDLDYLSNSVEERIRKSNDLFDSM